jgi:hypothetical protein
MLHKLKIKARKVSGFFEKRIKICAARDKVGANRDKLPHSGAKSPY